MGKSSIEFRFKMTNNEEPGDESRSGSSSVGDESILDDAKREPTASKKPEAYSVESDSSFGEGDTSFDPSSFAADDPESAFVDPDELDEDRLMLEKMAKELFIDPDGLNDDALIKAIQQARDGSYHDAPVESPEPRKRDAIDDLTKQTDFSVAKLEKGRYVIAAGKERYQVHNVKGKEWQLAFSKGKTQNPRSFTSKKAAVAFVEEGGRLEANKVAKRKAAARKPKAKKAFTEPKGERIPKQSVLDLVDDDPNERYGSSIQEDASELEDGSPVYGPPESTQEQRWLEYQKQLNPQASSDFTSLEDKFGASTPDSEPLAPPPSSGPPESPPPSGPTEPPDPPEPPGPTDPPEPPDDDDDDLSGMSEVPDDPFDMLDSDDPQAMLDAQRRADARRKRYDLTQMAKRERFNVDSDHRGDAFGTIKRRTSNKNQLDEIKRQDAEQAEVTTTDRIVRRLGAFGIARSMGGSGQLMASAMEVGVFQKEEKNQQLEKEAKDEYMKSMSVDIDKTEKDYSGFVKQNKAQEKREVTKVVDEARFQMSEGMDVNLDDVQKSIDQIESDFASQREAATPDYEKLFADMPASFFPEGSEEELKTFFQFIKDGVLNFDSFGEGLNATTLTILKTNLIVEGLNIASAMLTGSIKGLGSVLSDPENLNNTISTFASGAVTASKLAGGVIGARQGYNKGQAAEVAARENPDMPETPETPDDQRSVWRNEETSTTGEPQEAPEGIEALEGSIGANEPVNLSQSTLDALKPASAGPSTKDGVAPTLAEPSSEEANPAGKVVQDGAEKAGKAAIKGGGAIAGKAAGSAAGAVVGMLGGPPGAAVGGMAGGAVGSAIGEKVSEPIMELVKAGVQMMNSIAEQSIAPETLLASIDGELKLFGQKLEQAFEVDDITAELVEARTGLSSAIIDMQTELMQLFGPAVTTVVDALTILVRLGNEVLEVIKSILKSSFFGVSIADLLAPVAAGIGAMADYMEEVANNTSPTGAEEGDIEAAIQQFFSQGQFTDGSQRQDNQTFRGANTFFN